VLIPIDFCSINPARSFGPALVTFIRTEAWFTWRYQYIFWVGPLFGATLAGKRERRGATLAGKRERRGATLAGKRERESEGPRWLVRERERESERERKRKGQRWLVRERARERASERERGATLAGKRERERERARGHAGW
jgi:hypothetical protein